MRLSSLPLSVLSLVPLLSSVRAQDQGQNQTGGSNPSDYGQQCVQALQNAGFAGLAGLFSQVNSTQTGQALIMELSSGKNFTVFAPDNQALQNVPSSVTGNASLLAEYLSYHIVSGDFQNTSYTNSSSGGGGGVGGGATSSSAASSSTGSSSESMSSTESSSSTTSVDTASAPETPTATAALWGGLFPRQDSANSYSGGGGSSSSSPQPFAGVWPNVTIGRTLLNASDLVSLEGNKSQVLAWTRSGEDGNVTILNQAVNSQNVTVVNGTIWRNLFVNGITGVLVPPGNLSTALTAVNATAFQTLLQTEVPSSNGTNETALQFLEAAPGVTIFVPDDMAFTSEVNNTLQGLQGNQSAVTAILQNHYLNGTTLYSTEIMNNSQFITAAGESISFSQNGTGTFVSGPNGTSAQIVRPDVLLKNGVAHIIDRVFVVESTNPSAASMAYESATSEAAISTTETAPITAIAGAGGGAMSTATESSGQSSTSESSAMSTSSSESSTSSESSSGSTQSATNTSRGGGGSQSTDTASATAITRAASSDQTNSAASHLAAEPYLMFSVLVSVVSGTLILSV